MSAQDPGPDHRLFLDLELKAQLETLRAEPAPERLVRLARQLQDVLGTKAREVEPGEP